MNKLKILLTIIGIVQIVLGLLYLFIPMQFLNMNGHTVPAADIAYPLAMLAARFLAYGIGMLFIARNPADNIFWIYNMIFIQIVDLAAGILYTATGVVDWHFALLPMVNASIFIILLWFWRPRIDEQARREVAPAD
jgi:hypothetical protein